MKKFEMTMTDSPKEKAEFFTEDDAPKWLTSEDSVKGSTMDNRWFWNDHVLTLPVGGIVKTDFRTIKRIL